MAPKIKIIPESYPGAELIFDLGSLPPRPVPGTGIAKYNTITRPRKRDLQEFQSESPLQVTFSVILDEWATNGNLIDPYYRLIGWGARNGLPSGPTVLRTEGPIPFSNLRWKLTNYEPIEERQRPSDLALCYFEMKLELTEWNDIDLIVQGTQTPPPPASPALDANERFRQEHAAAIAENPKLAIAFGVEYKGGGGASAPQQQRTYTVKGGDSLSKIAAKELGNINRWKDIASLNGLRDPNRINIGQTLKLPS